MRIKYTLMHINASTLMHPRCSARGDLLESMNHCNAAGGNSSAVIWYLDMLPIYDAQRVHFTQLNQSEFSKQTSEIARKRTNLQYPLLVADAAPTNREGWIEALVKHPHCQSLQQYTLVPWVAAIANALQINCKLSKKTCEPLPAVAGLLGTSKWSARRTTAMLSTINTCMGCGMTICRWFLWSLQVDTMNCNPNGKTRKSRKISKGIAPVVWAASERCAITITSPCHVAWNESLLEKECVKRTTKTARIEI